MYAAVDGSQINVAISSTSRFRIVGTDDATAMRTHFIADESGPAGDEPSDLAVAVERAARPGHPSPEPHVNRLRFPRLVGQHAAFFEIVRDVRPSNIRCLVPFSSGAIGRGWPATTRTGLLWAR